MQRDAYASYDQYKAMQRAMNNLQINRDTLERLIELDRDLHYAREVLEALELGRGECLHQGRELYNSIKRKFIQQISWLGRRQFFELVQLCRLAESFSNRSSFIYESEAAETIEALDCFDPSVIVNVDAILNHYSLRAMLPEVIELMDGTHTVCQNYRQFLEDGHSRDEEPLREERMVGSQRY